MSPRGTEMLFAALGLLVCAALLLHSVMGESRRQSLQRAWQRAWQRGLWSARQRFQSHRSKTAAVNKPQADRVHRAAAEEAQNAIERARRGKVDAERVGNVIRPRAFKDKPNADDLLH